MNNLSIERNFSLLLIMLLFTQGCEKEKKSSLPFDGDGNKYDTIVIGTQTWLSENIKTTRYRDGRQIPLVTDATKWSETTLPAYCWYDNHQGSNEVYGALYNWNAAKLDYLCPTGYHIPSIDEWNTLVNYLGGSEIAGGKLKETGITFWLSPNTAATNESGFSARAGGARFNDGGFELKETTGLWWTNSEKINDSRYAWYVYISNRESQVYTGTFPKITGFSVRCLKD